MDLELGNDDDSEEICIEDEDYSIDSVFEKERCGICIDIVIDRGMLNCCDHWFCFACIDNWATITNFCPICKNEFQLITCLPVYDTVGSVTSEEYPLSRNEDWSIQGKNNALSFPSYYISEDAVKCLENDGCKIRSLQGTDDLSFDTSIACDSCDIWYHAFCVGFNPQFTSEDSWLCPRCIHNEVLQTAGAVQLKSLVKYSEIQTAENGWTIDPSLSGKVSVSVADTGDTAVVISMIAGKQKTDCEVSLIDKLDSNMDLEITKSTVPSNSETSETTLLLKDGSCKQTSQDNLILRENNELFANTSDIDNRSEVFFDLLPEIISFEPCGDLKEAAMSPFFHDATMLKSRNDITESQSLQTLEDVPFSSCFSQENDEEKNIDSLKARSDSVFSDGYMDTSFVGLCTSAANKEPSKSCNNVGTYFSATTTSSADNMETSCDKDMLVDICQSRKGCNSSADPIMNKTLTINMDKNNGCIRKREQEDAFPSKKPKFDRKFRTLPTGNLSTFFSLDDPQVCSRKMRTANVAYAEQDEAESPDIMSIIQENDCKSHDMPKEMKAANDLIDKRDSTCGLRVKKIMRRVGEKRESSILAQELGREIREVVQKKTLKDVGKNNFDENLLAAFRAAIVRPQNELARSERVLVGSKMPLPVKGHKRQNLTKKIYGTSSGRRRHAWARDLEIEFWKHRCRSSQYEKVETLQSVLELLKKATNPNWNSYTKSEAQEESANSILSRVYVADASVFPRKDDIKPLSARSESSHLDNHNLDEEKSTTKAANKSVMKSFGGDTLNRKVNSGKATSDPISGSKCSKESIATSMEHSCPSDAKSEKKKWALEVLARKTASASTNVNNGQENGALFERNYPLLAQLPQDMRPMLASTRHNKVSASIRQAQLYRITEHYLRKVNLPVIRRTAETELAVADAVNMEKEILKGSNSKLVYVNLCSQAVSQVVKMRESDKASISNPPMATNEADESTKCGIGTDKKPESTETNDSASVLPISGISNAVPGQRDSNPKSHGWSNVEEALKMAGLFSDSPPSSPLCGTKYSNEDEFISENVYEILNFDKTELAETNISCSALPTSKISSEVSCETNVDSKACGWSNVEEPLRITSLFCNTLSSPYCTTEDTKEEECAHKNIDEILNFVNHPESAETNVSSSTLPTTEISLGKTTPSSIARGWSIVEEALNMAGTKDSNEDECAQENVKEILNYGPQSHMQIPMDTEGNASANQNPEKDDYDCNSMAVDLSDFNSLKQQNECRPVNCNSKVRMDVCLPTKAPEMEICNDLSLEECEGRNNLPLISEMSEKPLVIVNEKNLTFSFERKSGVSVKGTNSCFSGLDVGLKLPDEISAGRENIESQMTENLHINPIICDDICNEDITKSTNNKSDLTISISKMVEAYIKEHIRPLCKSGVITVDQYRWAVEKTLAKVMKFHHKAKNANFLIREGEKVKKLAEKYVEAAQKQN